MFIHTCILVQPSTEPSPPTETHARKVNRDLQSFPIRLASACQCLISLHSERNTGSGAQAVDEEDVDLGLWFSFKPDGWDSITKRYKMECTTRVR